MKHTTRFLSVMVALAMVIGMFSMLGPISVGAASAAYDGTSVTPTQVSSSTYASLGIAADKWEQYNGYYAIRTAAELYGFAELVTAGDGYAKAVLLDDIVVNSGTISDSGSSSGTTHYWYGIGGTEKENYFRGTFDGNGHYISGLYYKEPEGQSVSYIGFFRVLAGATVKNLTLKNTYFYAESDIGAIAGHVIGNTSYIDNCRIEEDVTVVKGTEGQEPYIGGIIGGNPLGGYMSTWPVYCRITDSVFLGVVQAMHADFTGGNSNRDFVGAISGASMRAGNAHKHVVLSNCFFKEGCVIDKNGNSKYKNGSSTFVFDTAMGGGYNNQGYWGTSAGATKIASASASHSPVVGEHKAIKEGDSDYKYCVICDKRIATLTVDAPTTYVLPGASMQLTASADYSEVTSFSIASGTNYTGSGMTIKISADALVGSEITVKVTSGETANVHAAETTVTYKVGVVDSTTEIARLQEELDNAIAALSTALMAADEDLSDEIDALQKAMTNAQNAIATLQNNSATKEQLTALENALKQADTEITAAYTKAINDAKSELETLIAAVEEAAAKGDEALEATLRAYIAEVQGNLEKLIEAAEEAAAKGDEALEAALREHISQVRGDLEALIAAAEETAKKEAEAMEDRLTDYIYSVHQQLEELVREAEKAAKDGDETLEATLRAYIAEVQEGLETLIAAAEEAAINHDNALKEELTKAIEDAVKAAQDANTALEEKLQGEIDAAAQDAQDANNALEEKLQSEIDGAAQDAKDANDALEEKLQNNIDGAVKKAEDELSAADASLQAAISKVQENLDKAIEDLDAAMKAGDADLSAKIANLNAALETAKAVLEAADAENKSALEDRIDAAAATLQTAIDALSAQLNNVKNELENAKSELANKDSELQTFIIIVCVIAGVAFCGCGTLATFYIIDKKKK